MESKVGHIDKPGYPHASRLIVVQVQTFACEGVVLAFQGGIAQTIK
jgi:hypothetical protein